METGTDGYLDRSTPFGENYNEYTSTFSSDAMILLVESDDSHRGRATPVHRLARGRPAPAAARQVGLIDRRPDQTGERRDGADIVRRGDRDQGVRSPRACSSRYVPSNTFTMVQVSLDTGLSKDQSDSGAQQYPVARLEHGRAPRDDRLGDREQRVLAADGGRDGDVDRHPDRGRDAPDDRRDGPPLRVRQPPLPSRADRRHGPDHHVRDHGAVGIKISMAAIGAFPILIGLGIDYAIQFQSRLEEESRKGSLVEAIRHTMENTGPAVFYAMFATAMGFVALFLSPVPMIRGFALVSIIGIATCYVVSLIGIPVFGPAGQLPAEGGPRRGPRGDRVRPVPRHALGPDREESPAPARRRRPRGPGRGLARPVDSRSPRTRTRSCPRTCRPWS